MPAIRNVIKSRKNKIKCVYSDFETTIPPEGQDPEVWLADICVKQNGQWTHTLVHTINRWFAVLYKYPLKHRYTIVWFHNIKFDSSYFISYFLGQGFKVINYPPDPKTDNKSFYIHTDGSRVYSVTLAINGGILKFKDSLKILPTSIEKLGKSLGITKMGDITRDEYAMVTHPFRYLEDIPTRWIEYVKRDTLILAKSLEAFDGMLNELKCVQYAKLAQDIDQDNYLKYGKKPRQDDIVKFTHHFNTIARISWELMSLHITNHYGNTFMSERDLLSNLTEGVPKALLIEDADEWEYARNYMGGGITQFNINATKRTKVQHPELCVIIDVNSAYPHFMRKLVPYGNLLELPPEDSEYITLYEVRVIRARIKKQSASFPLWFTPSHLRKDGETSRFRSEIKNELCYFFAPEFEALKRHYDIRYEIEQTYYLRAYPFVTEHIEDLYAKRAEYKRVGNEAFREGVKLLLNSGFGCLAQEKDYGKELVFPKSALPEYHGHDDNTVCISLGDKCYTVLNQQPWKYNRFDAKDPYILIRTVERIPAPYGRNKWFAAWITSQERTNLINTIADFGCDQTWYCDTDSLALYLKSLEQFAKLKEICDDNELGKWKVETTNVLEFRVIKSKVWMYKYEDGGKIIKKVKFAGVTVPNAAEMYDKIIGAEGQDIYIEDANLIAVNDRGMGIVLKPRDKVIDLKGRQ